MNNQHIFDYLKYYLGLRAPEYAVMINGAWGIGKTFAIDAFRNARKGQGIIYVSLYGVKTAEEIDQGIVNGMMPLLNTTVGKIGGRLVGSVAKTFGAGEVIKAGELSKLAAPDTIIFDDFERAAMDPVELLGYINQWVEHERQTRHCPRQ